MFECNICLDTASEPVVTMCGHFYCWPCIALWLERSDECPVCKSKISKEKIIPVYARGSEKKDPRKNVPPRPAGHREEPDHRRNNHSNNNGGGSSAFNFSTSFGVFPFPGLTFTFNNGAPRNNGFFNYQYSNNFNSQRTQHNTNTNGQNGQNGQNEDERINYIVTAIFFFIIFLFISYTISV